MTSVQDLRQQYREQRQQSLKQQLPISNEPSWSSLDNGSAPMETGDETDGSVSSSLSAVAARRFLLDATATRRVGAPLDGQTLQEGQSWGGDVAAKNKMMRAPK